jgi:hypothetical protein
MRLDPRQPGVGQRDIERVIERVDADDLVATRQQGAGDVHAYEAGDTSDQDLHENPLTCRSARPWHGGNVGNRQSGSKTAPPGFDMNGIMDTGA